MAAGFAIALLVSGCATLQYGSTQVVNFETPGVTGAHCEFTQGGGEPQAVDASGAARVARAKSDLVVECRKEGYEVARAVASPVGSTHVELPIGMLIDAISEANYSYPDVIKVEMHAPLRATAE
jgi:hypothetical protein